MGAVAFFRVEGSLVRSGVISAAAYFAANGAGVGERLLRLGHVALTGPVYGLLGQSDRVMANRLAYLSLRGMSEDRIEMLSEEYFSEILQDQILAGGLDLLRKVRRQGHEIVLMSDGLTPVVQRLRDALPEVAECLCNRMEFRDDRATGRLLDPVIGGHDSARWAEDYVQRKGIALEDCVFYGSHGPDMLLMTQVGSRCAVNPDFTLRRAAREADWPVMDIHA